MRAGWDERLGATKGLGELETLLLVDALAEKWQVVPLFFFDVLGEVGHQLLEGWDELWSAGFEVLELLEVLLDLFRELVDSSKFDERQRCYN